MKRFLFTVAAVALVASVGSAQEAPVTAPPVTSGPIVVGTQGAPVVEYGPAMTTARRGLFGRLRSRGTTMAPTYTTGPVITGTPGTVISPTPMPTLAPMPSVPAPMPMPMPGTKSSEAMPMPGGIIVVGGVMDSNMMMPSSGVITTAGYSEPMAPRRGLFGRRSR